MNQEPDLPRVTAAQLAVLRRITTTTVYVLRDPGHVGAGLTRSTLDRLTRLDLIHLGDYQALLGRPLTLTDLGQQVLDANVPQT